MIARTTKTEQGRAFGGKLLRHRCLKVEGALLPAHLKAISRSCQVELLDADAAGGKLLDVESFDASLCSIGQVRSVPQAWHSGINVDGDAESVHDVTVLLLHEGFALGNFGGRNVHLDAGDLILINHARPFVLAFGSFTATAIRVKRQLLPRDAPMADHGSALGRDHAVTQYLVAQAAALLRAGPSLPHDAFTSAVQACLEFLIHSIASRASESPSRSLGNRSALYQRACSFIDRNATNGQLSPATLALHLGTSRAVLYRLFESDGGVAAYIRALRLDRCFELLLRDTELPASVSAIAHQHGFQSEAHFSRAFKKRFGVSPVDVRKVSGARAKPQNVAPQYQIALRYIARMNSVIASQAEDEPSDAIRNATMTRSNT